MLTSIWTARLGLFFSNPLWAVREMVGRVRTHFAPSDGSRLRTFTPGPVQFCCHFRIGKMARQMYVDAYESHVIGLMKAVLRAGDTFVDVGANCGYLSARAAGLVGASGRVLSFEPGEKQFRLLKEARSLNPDYRWDLFNLAVGNVNATGDLAVAKSNFGWCSLVPGNVPDSALRLKAQVQIRPLDEILQEQGVSKVRFVKIDVEGFEGAVLAGLKRMLSQKRIDHLIVEINPSQWELLGIDLADTIKEMDGWGYRLCDPRRPQAPQAQAFSSGSAPDMWFRGSSA